MVVRLCGVYLKMMEHLPHIGWDVFRSLNNLFEFNLYAVFTNFIAADDITQFLRGKGGNAISSDATRWNGLRTGICRIADEINAGEMLLQSSALIYPSSADTGNLLQQNSPMSRKVTLRKVSRTPAAVEDADESNLYALAERSIACEAIVGQCRLMNAIEDLARSYLPDRYLCLMDEVYERNRTMARELRNFMYNSIATKLVDVPVLLDSVSAVSWDIPYISDQHNEYIVHLVQSAVRPGEACRSSLMDLFLWMPGKIFGRRWFKPSWIRCCKLFRRCPSPLRKAVLSCCWTCTRSRMDLT